MTSVTFAGSPLHDGPMDTVGVGRSGVARVRFSERLEQTLLIVSPFNGSGLRRFDFGNTRSWRSSAIEPNQTNREQK